jgi:hypothetical protein
MNGEDEERRETESTPEPDPSPISGITREDIPSPEDAIKNERDRRDDD